MHGFFETADQAKKQRKVTSFCVKQENVQPELLQVAFQRLPWQVKWDELKRRGILENYFGQQQFFFIVGFVLIYLDR